MAGKRRLNTKNHLELAPYAQFKMKLLGCSGVDDFDLWTSGAPMQLARGLKGKKVLIHPISKCLQRTIHA